MASIGPDLSAVVEDFETICRTKLHMLLDSMVGLRGYRKPKAQEIVIY